MNQRVNDEKGAILKSLDPDIAKLSKFSTLEIKPRLFESPLLIARNFYQAANTIKKAV